MSKEWKYGNIQFEADQFSDTLLRYAPWSGHRQFGYDLVTYYQPDCMVELGSHYGCSTFAFMQAIKDNSINTKICVVDLWEASDIYTKHDYERDIYDFFKMVYEKCFSELNAEIMKMSFDQANKKFGDSSIDIIHIDGSHEYDDVKHDFELWFPKMKKNGIMIFHDISDQEVLGDVMGSHIFWNAIKERYSTTVELKYSWGLGILFLSEDMYRDFINKVDLEYYLKLNLHEESLCKDRIRRDYFRLVDDNKWIESLKDDINTLNKERQKLLDELEIVKNDYEVTAIEKEKYIQELKQTIDSYKNQNEEIQQDYEATVSDKEKYIQELKQTIDSYKNQNEEIQQDYEATVSDKEKYIQELKQTIDSYKNQNEEIQQDYEVTISDKEKYIQELQQTIDSYKKQNEEIQHDYDVTISEKDIYILELQQTIEGYRSQNEKLQSDYEDTIAGKEKYINELIETLDMLNKHENSTD